MNASSPNPVATVTTTSADGSPVDIAAMAGYITFAEAAERTGRTPWAIHQLTENGHLTTVAFNGRPHVSEADIAALI